MKTRLRSLLWVFMALTLLLAGTTLVCAYDISFSDVPESSWFYEDVMTLSESGVVSGYPDGTYRPTKKVTTGESLKMILLAAGYPEPERVEFRHRSGLPCALSGYFRSGRQYDARDARQAGRKRARPV